MVDRTSPGPAKRRAILIVDHGSRNPDAATQLEALAERIRARAPDAIVRTAHLELTAPDFAEGLAACIEAGATEIVVHPYFLAPGRHTREDLPRLIEAARTHHPTLRFHLTPPLGLDDRLVDLVLDRITATTDPSDP